MKKNLLVSFVLLAAALNGCASDGDEPGGNAEIRVGAEVLAAETKAPVSIGAEFTAAVTALETESGATPDWAAEPTGGAWWQNSLTLIARLTTGGGVGLDTPKEYHPTRTTHLAAWHPNVKSAKGVVTFSTSVGAGTQDVMWGGTLSGSRTTPIAAAFRFTHALTQLSFVARASGDYLQAGSEATILAVEVQSARLPKSLTLADGKLTYAAAAPLAVPGSAALKLTGIAAPIGEPLMIGAMDQVEIKVTYQIGTETPETKEAVATIFDTTGETPVPLRVLAGYSHKITLVLGRNGLDISARVEDWKEGNGGNVNI